MKDLRPRIDPFADRARHLSTVHGRTRLDRAACIEQAQVRLDPAPRAPFEILIDEPSSFVMAVIDPDIAKAQQHLLQLLGAGRWLADAAGAALLVLSAASLEGATLGKAGADRFAILPEPATPQARACLVVEAMAKFRPLHVLFAETLDGGDLARRVAALTGNALFSETEVITPHKVLRASHARQFETSRTPTALIALRADVAAPYGGAPHAAKLLEFAPSIAERHPEIPMLHAGDPAQINLAEARFVVAAGQGVTDFERFAALVSVLGATPGASRVVCDLGLLPRALQVGASGSVLQAECYMALGISGAPQHLQGLGRVDHVIAVNTDLHAAMVARADLAIIGDAEAVAAALLEALAAGA